MNMYNTGKLTFFLVRQLRNEKLEKQVWALFLNDIIFKVESFSSFFKGTFWGILELGEFLTGFIFILP